MTESKDDALPVRPETGGGNGRGAGRWLGVHSLLPLALPSMLIAGILACWGTVASYRAEPMGPQAIRWTLTMMAVALSTSSIVLSWYSSRNRCAALQRQLEALTTSGKTDLLEIGGAGEFSGLVAALNLYVAQVRNRVARLHLQKKELDIQTRIGEAERRCVETIVEKITEGVIVTDAFDDVVLANTAAQEVLGFSLGAAYRQPIHRAVRNPAVVQLIKSMRNLNEPAQRNVKIRVNDDTARPQVFRASLNRVMDPRGHVHGVVTVLRAVEQFSAAENP